MASHDLRRILAGWDYEPHQITVRKIAGDDGAIKIQMRLPLGVLQMEVSGRPDGVPSGRGPPRLSLAARSSETSDFPTPGSPSRSTSFPRGTYGSHNHRRVAGRTWESGSAVSVGMGGPDS